MNLASNTAVAGMIATIVLSATAGDVAIAAAMEKTGDLSEIWKARGWSGAVGAVLGNGLFFAGVACMAVSFFALLFSLSHADVSLIAPAAGSLTFVANAVAAKWILREKVDGRRWIAAILVCCGVALLKG
ncbi:MAG TPA: hypothetical protein VHX11_06005 [Acidobacteriaceae bacterium]|nr:hypothetical protein [Acidobacteriaceae bacterium]